MTTQAAQMDPVTQNLMARQNLLTTGIKMVKKLPPIQLASINQSFQIPLLRMGIMTGVTIQFTLGIDAGAAHPTPSPYFPHNLVSSIQYTDFAGVNRTKTAGWQLWAAQSAKSGELIGATPFQSGTQKFGAWDTNQMTTYDTANAWANNSANNPVTFSLYVPMAYDPGSDLTGAVLTQTNVGEHYITVQLSNALLNAADAWAAPFVAGNATLNAAGITVQAFQHYIQPQNLMAQSLPLIDLSTVYGFEGAYQNTANIAAGQSTYVNYPNNRSILSALVLYENGGTFTLNETDINQITLLANSNTNFWEMNPRLMRHIAREIMGGDLASGAYYFSHRRQPILTQLYANVQAKFDVVTANAGVTQFVSQFEVQYPSGSPLPGITG